jgi:biotin carboxyl carrier protein
VPTYCVTVEGKTYQVEIPDPGAAPLQVIVDGQVFEVGILNPEAQVAPAAPVASADTRAGGAGRAPASRPPPPRSREGEAISAPMPGTILSVEVEQGQDIEGGQVVCVLEAMKMKNPIRAASAGTVARVHIRVGQSVAYGDLMVELA